MIRVGSWVRRTEDPQYTAENIGKIVGRMSAGLIMSWHVHWADGDEGNYPTGWLRQAYRVKAEIKNQWRDAWDYK